MKKSSFEETSSKDEEFLNELLDSIEGRNGARKPPQAPKEEEKALIVTPAKRCLKDINFLDMPSEETPSKDEPKMEKSVVHTGDTDSSDDEDNKYFEETKYNSCGKSIKESMKKRIGKAYGKDVIPNDNYWKPKPKENEEPKLFGLPKKPAETQKSNQDYMMEPFFGLRLVNPLYSSVVLQEKMSGRTPVSFFKLKKHVEHSDLKNDWVLAGVIVGQSPPKISQKGSKYAIWTLSDLRVGMKTAGVFLFGKSYEKLWKTSLGTVIGILNPNVMNKNDKSKDEATLSIMSPDQVMIWGRSKDFGTCKGLKKNGEKCTAFVNLSQCEYCVYHVQSEYRKYTSRGELQGSTCGLDRNKLRNKVFGKDEVFYGGKVFTSIPVVGSNKKKRGEDVKRLNGLGIQLKSPPKQETNFLSMNSRAADLLNMLKKGPGEMTQQAKDNNRLKSLGTSSSKPNPKSSSVLSLPPPVLTDPEKDLEVMTQKVPNPRSHLQSKFNSLLSLSPQNSKSTKIPSLPDKKVERQESGPNDEKEVKRSPIPIPNRTSNSPSTPTSRISKAKQKALEFVKKNGQISKPNPKGLTKEEVIKRNLKRLREDEDDEGPPQKQVFSERFLELMKKESKHKELVDEFHRAEEDAYYLKMEKKEQMEEKMMGTYKIDCKAVSCLKCKYTWFSASEACKEERHPLKVVDGVKRFFKCAKCDNRTVSLNIIPVISCKKCGSSSWEKTSMMKERFVKKSHQLSIRGGEQTFINSVVQNGSLDLLVPE